MRWLRYCALPGFITFLMFFSILARGSMTSRPQPVQRILKSMPTRSTSKLDAPAGVLFAGEDGISHSDVHIYPTSPFFSAAQTPGRASVAAARIAGAAHTDIV